MDLSFWRSSNYGSVFWRSSDYRTWKNDHGEEFLLVSSKVKQNGPAAATKMNTSKFMKLEVCKCGESGGCRPINNVTSKSIFSSVLCGACHMLLDHFLHKHKWRSSKVTYSKTFYILDPHPGDINRPDGQGSALAGALSLCCVHRRIAGSKFKCRLPLSRTEPSYSRAMMGC